MLVISSAFNVGFEEGCKYLPFIIASAVLFRLAHFPDIGIEGTFALGSSTVIFAHQNNLPEPVGIIFSIILGLLGGMLTGIFFVKFKLNSLVCGIITTLVSYGICFVLLGFKSTGEISTFISEFSIGIVGLFLSFTLCIFFSTRLGLLVRISGESPTLVSELGTSPNKYLLFLLMAGNAISSLSGSLIIGAEGSTFLGIGDMKLFLAISSLVFGEAILSLFAISFFKILNLFSNIMRENKVRKRWPSFFQNYIAGTEAIYPILGAIIGSFTYWIVYNLCINAFNADEYTKTIIGIVTAVLLVISTFLSSKYHQVSAWTFHGAANW